MNRHWCWVDTAYLTAIGLVGALAGLAVWCLADRILLP